MYASLPSMSGREERMKSGHYIKKNIFRVIHHNLLHILPHNYLDQTSILQIKTNPNLN